MPVYAYRCITCDYVQEITQKISELEESRIYCTSCWREAGITSPMKRLIGTPTVIFKGQGFYSTDNPKTEKMQRKVKREEWQ